MKWFLAKAALFGIVAWPLVGSGAPPVRIVQGCGAVEVEAVAANIVRIHFQPAGKVTHRTLMMEVQDASGKTLLKLGGARVSGRRGTPPMPPKWTLGFLNSQWVSNEDEWRQLVDRFWSCDGGAAADRGQSPHGEAVRALTTVALI